MSLTGRYAVLGNAFYEAALLALALLLSPAWADAEFREAKKRFLAAFKPDRPAIEREAAALGVERREVDAQEIVDRLLFALVNEGMNILDEGIAQRPGDIDVVYVYGYGFPAWRGGPMHYADAVGLPQVLERVRAFEKRFGAENWAPAPLLERLVADGRSLKDWAERQ